MMTVDALFETPLHATHVALGAKMVPFAGWSMPLQYSRVLEEHRAVRQSAGLFDISHMGLLALQGDSHAVQTALNALVPQEIDLLEPTKAVYTQVLNESGCMLDDIIVYHLPLQNRLPEWPEWLVICNASNTAKITNWFGQHLPSGVTLTVMNTQYCLLALQGPQFDSVLRAAGMPADVALPKRFHIESAQLGTVPVFLSRTGYTGEDGVEIIVSKADVVHLWNTLLDTGRPLGLCPVGLAARDTLRLEAVYPLYGHELDEVHTPLEAGLGWSVKLNKAQAYVGQVALQQQRKVGLTQHLICFEVPQKAIPRPHDLLYDMDGTLMGAVTSGSISPTLNRPIGVGYVRGDVPPSPGTPLQVEIRGQKINAIVVKKPFYQR